MKLFRRQRGPAVSELSPDDLRAEIDALSAAAPDREAERRLLALRYELGKALLGGDGSDVRHVEADMGALPAERLPEIAAADLTPGLLRAGILRDGCLLVRGLVPREQALELAAEIDTGFGERLKVQDGKKTKPGYYEEFVPTPPHKPLDDMRPWIQRGGGILAGDSPRLTANVLRMLRAANFDAIAQGYLGEAPLISVDKTTLRKATPDVAGAWHQDGKFMGDVRALNLWLSLSRCGDEAPGLDIVPRRLEHLVEAGTDGTFIDIQIADDKAREAAGDVGVQRPIFEPGDALLFDDLFLHQTASDPSMPKPRYAVESWFFGASGFPVDYSPLAV